MQGMGAGKPYNLKSGIHFSMRYGMRAQPGIRVGVYHKTPRLMAEHEARESGARQALRLLGKPWRDRRLRSEEHTSELQSLMRISYAVFCLKKKKKLHTHTRQLRH